MPKFSGNSFSNLNILLFSYFIIIVNWRFLGFGQLFGLKLKNFRTFGRRLEYFPDEKSPLPSEFERVDETRVALYTQVHIFAKWLIKWLALSQQEGRGFEPCDELVHGGPRLSPDVKWD